MNANHLPRPEPPASRPASPNAHLDHLLRAHRPVPEPCPELHARIMFRVRACREHPSLVSGPAAPRAWRLAWTAPLTVVVLLACWLAWRGNPLPAPAALPPLALSVPLPPSAYDLPIVDPLHAELHLLTQDLAAASRRLLATLP